MASVAETLTFPSLDKDQYLALVYTVGPVLHIAHFEPEDFVHAFAPIVFLGLIGVIAFVLGIINDTKNNRSKHP